MAICDWPEQERPREKLWAQGAASLSDAELLAILLRTGCRGRSAVEMARDLVTSFGGLRALLRADPRRLRRQTGLGLAKVTQLQAVMEIARRQLMEDLKRGATIESPGMAGPYLTARMRDYDREVFACIFLDSRHRIIIYEELFSGTLDCAQIHPREVVRRALDHNAAAVILAHNHPSGLAEPSQADRDMTRRLKDALKVVGVRVLDHLVVGDGEPVSLAALGLC